MEDEGYLEDSDAWEEQEAWPRDTKVDEAKEALMADLFTKRHEVLYGRQIEVLFERRFYHWITTKALNELAAEGKIQSVTMPLEMGGGEEVIRFYWSRKTRYWRRQAEEIRQLVNEFSHPDMGWALGHHGELMFDAALSRFGWLHKGQNVRAYRGKEWAKTEHDLDRVLERDGVSYGVEIKNRLRYITKNELEIKIEMCRELALTPLFILRMVPSNYIELVRQAGGFTLVFEWQLYPFGRRDLAKRVRERLGLKVDSPKAINDGTIQRLLNWHVKNLAP